MKSTQYLHNNPINARALKIKSSGGFTFIVNFSHKSFITGPGINFPFISSLI